MGHPVLIASPAEGGQRGGVRGQRGGDQYSTGGLTNMSSHTVQLLEILITVYYLNITFM